MMRRLGSIDRLRDGRRGGRSGRGSCRTIRSRRTCRCGWRARRGRIRSVSTNSAATCSRACSPGARISLLVGLAVVVGLGDWSASSIGAIAGYLGGVVRRRRSGA